MTALVLASASETRARLLRDAGVAFEVKPARIDETSVREAMRADDAAPGDAAQMLADLKSMRLSPSLPETLVLGADQILECDGAWYDKPTDHVAAGRQLAALSGRTHQLWTAAAIAKDGAVIWREMTRVRLTMRTLSADFIESYLEREGDRVLQSVGGYQVEGRGVQLFSSIGDDFFSILGLPLLPLLAFLRTHEVIEA